MKQIKLFVGPKASDEWRTPPALFAAVRRDFLQRRETVDMAATRENTLSPYWCGPGSPLNIDDALQGSWEDAGNIYGQVWCNPPYSQPLLAMFVEKFLRSQVAGVMLVPASVETQWFRAAMTGGKCHEVWFLTRRVPYLRPDGKRASQAMFPSCLLVKHNTKAPARPNVGYWSWEAK